LCLLCFQRSGIYNGPWSLLLHDLLQGLGEHRRCHGLAYQAFHNSKKLGSLFVCAPSCVPEWI
jgi:hypothetical protein